MKSRGKMILFADADGASKFSDFERLENSLLKNASKSLEVREIELRVCFVKIVQ
jgi:hypothetical protein